jgi:hypothetical protein
MNTKKFAVELNTLFTTQFEMLKRQPEWKEAFSHPYPASIEDLILAWLPSACNNAASVMSVCSEEILREDAMKHLDAAKALLNKAGYKLNIAITSMNGKME